MAHNRNSIRQRTAPSCRLTSRAPDQARSNPSGKHGMSDTAGQRTAARIRGCAQPASESTRGRPRSQPALRETQVSRFVVRNNRRHVDLNDPFGLCKAHDGDSSRAIVNAFHPFRHGAVDGFAVTTIRYVDRRLDDMLERPGVFQPAMFLIAWSACAPGSFGRYTRSYSGSTRSRSSALRMAGCGRFKIDAPTVNCLLGEVKTVSRRGQGLQPCLCVPRLDL